ncbi:NEURAL PRECURSOR CELL EXPRESSED, DEVELOPMENTALLY DOWN-REGULATED GENE 1 [Hibiscus trionum]|uniref:NEURAL CELL EXPRESSED, DEVELOPMENTALLY DOWN-REGULATED GENE 1 n=1 Tax=Hibiscus trionum TaxID=183268 RepID=A0A9W7HZ36_HIBTR|nr:NEURAL PRECURSOR CELL EXPRESSED, DEVELOPMENTALLY DOWN-REGULATED GENE 1 [Hibiscus trionum]
MNLSDPSPELLASSGGDTVKIFDIKLEPNDPCVLSYSPSPSCIVNSIKWNHTNLVVASAGEDKKISLWRKNGQRIGTIPVDGTDSGDNIEESILAISFSNKGSRYICSGGSGQVVRVWDLQRKRCIKWLRGHTSSITGVMYNCKDEHLASISLSGDLILHNLASGAKAAELKDPNAQELKVLDYSRISRHILVTAGDDGSVHLWDTTGRSPKVSWLKQHSAPTAGVSFSPSNDKMIVSVGLDKKLYTYDSGSRRPSAFISYEAPFSSLAFRDDGWTLAAGTGNGRVVFYDIRGKLQPFTVLRAYSSSEAVSSLCWQRSKPTIVNESTCTAETALLGGAMEDSVLMPDPLPSVTSSSLSLSTAVSGSRTTGRSGPAEVSSLTSSGSLPSSLNLSSSLETPIRSHLWPGGTLTRLQPPRSTFNFKDDMEVFSPLVDVHPITPSLDKLWDGHDGAKKEHLPNDKKPSSLLFPSSRRFAFADDGASDHPILDWKSSSMSQQEDTKSFTALGSTPAPSSKSEEASITPPEAWGGEKMSDKFSHLRQLPSRFGMPTSGGLTSSSIYSGQDQSSTLSQTSISSLTSNLSYENLRTRDISSNLETSLGLPEHFSSSMSALSFGSKGITGAGSLDSPKLASLALPRRFSTYAERISTTSAFSDGTSHLVASPKTKKTGAETREELFNSLLSRSDSLTAAESGVLPAMNGGTLQPHKAPQQDPQQGSNFTLQLFQRTLEETLDSFQKSIHGDMRNLHIEILRQFHMQETEMSRVMSSILQNQAELMEEVKSLRKENQQLRQLL